jgi:hypothetical protein
MKQIVITIVLAAVLTIPFAPPPEEPEIYAAEQTEVETIEEQDFEPWDIPLSDDLQQYIYSLCEEYDISYAMVIAMIDVESSFDSKAVSSTSDYGLMQINAINHKDNMDYLNPYDNVEHGIKALNRLAEKYNEADLVAMCWNCGEAGARKLWREGIYSTEYSEKVIKKKIEYERSNGGN